MPKVGSPSDKRKICVILSKASARSSALEMLVRCPSTTVSTWTVAWAMFSGEAGTIDDEKVSTSPWKVTMLNVSLGLSSDRAFLRASWARSIILPPPLDRCMLVDTSST